MEFSPLEITQREFGRKFRGLDPEEVQTFLEQVAEEMTRLLQENTERAKQIQRYPAQDGFGWTNGVALALEHDPR